MGQTVDAGVVAEGTSATVSGNGPSNFSYQRQGDFAVADLPGVLAIQTNGTWTITPTL